MEQTQFLGLLQSALQSGASDIHLLSGNPPAFRIKGDLLSVKLPPITDSEMMQILGWAISSKNDRDNIQTIRDFDGSFEVKNLCRFRYNIYRTRGRIGIILRIIPASIPSIEKLGLPNVLTRIAEMPRGLVLVTGATGSGKSSTLAAMIDHINNTSPSHILTIEDPIEFVHPLKKARISQREVGKDTDSFAGALRSALRQDPDVILVGEMRDPETIDIALKAAETGHMVFSTVHTTDAIKTIGRLVSVFPPSEQKMVRMRLADNLISTISQRLLKKADGKGVVVAQEIMVSNAGIQECIANPELTGMMNDLITKSHETSGGQTFEQHLAQLYLNGIITLEEGKSASTNPQDFERNLMFGSNSKEGNATPKPTGIEQKIDLDLSPESKDEQKD
jgi:twitching motility protein PilT